MNSSEYLKILRTWKSKISHSMTRGEMNVFVEYLIAIGKNIKSSVLWQVVIKESVLMKETQEFYGQAFMGQPLTSHSHTISSGKGGKTSRAERPQYFHSVERSNLSCSKVVTSPS